MSSARNVCVESSSVGWSESLSLLWELGRMCGSFMDDVVCCLYPTSSGWKGGAAHAARGTEEGCRRRRAANPARPAGQRKPSNAHKACEQERQRRQDGKANCIKMDMVRGAEKARALVPPSLSRRRFSKRPDPFSCSACCVRKRSPERKVERREGGGGRERMTGDDDGGLRPPSGSARRHWRRQGGEGWGGRARGGTG